MNPPANNPLIAYLAFEKGNSIIAHTYNQMGEMNLISVSVALTIMIAAIGDVLSNKYEKEAFSFYVKPEPSPLSQNNISYPQKGTHMEFSYSIRF